MYYKNAEAVLITFSLTSSESFENLDKWITEIDKNATTNNYVKILVGTKCDCDDQKEIPYKEGQKYAKNNGAIYFETSAKDGTNVEEMFQQLADKLYTISITDGFGPIDKGKIKLNDKKSKRKKKKKGKGGCC